MHPATRVSTDTEYTLYCGIGDSTMQLARDRIGWFSRSNSVRIVMSYVWMKGPYWATFPTSRDLNVCVNVAARAPATSGPWPHRGTPGSGGLDEYSVVWTVERRIGISREPLAQEKHKRA